MVLHVLDGFSACLKHLAKQAWINVCHVGLMLQLHFKSIFISSLYEAYFRYTTQKRFQKLFGVGGASVLIVVDLIQFNIGFRTLCRVHRNAGMCIYGEQIQI